MMQKVSTVFVCSNCGNESTKWFGKCPACNDWNTCYEEKKNKKSGVKVSDKKQVTPTLLNSVEKQSITRTSTGFEELDRVLRWRFSKGFFNITWWRTRNR